MSASRVAIAAGVISMFAPAAAQAADFQVYRDASCGVNQVCVIDYDNIPRNKTVRLENMSCYVSFESSQDLAALQLVLMRNTNGRRLMAITPNPVFVDNIENGAGNFNAIYTANETIRVVGETGQHFRIYAQVASDNNGAIGTVTQLSCHISGTIN